jgi:tight adherence protein C
MGLLLGLLMGAAVFGIVTAVRMLRSGAPLPADLMLALEVGSSRVSSSGSAVDRLGMRFAPLVLRLMGGRAVDRKRKRIDQAGNPEGLTIDRYAARRAVYGVFGLLTAVIFYVAGWAFFSLFAVVFGALAADAAIWQGIRTRRDVIDRTLPDFLDVLAVVVSAGLGFRQALDRVSARYEGPWADEVRIALRQMDMGVSRRQAFNELRRRNDSEPVNQFVTALQQGEELGAPIADTLIQIARDMRRTDAQNARRRAARAIPMATMATLVFMVPATMIIIVTGMILGSGTDFAGILGDD